MKTLRNAIKGILLGVCVFCAILVLIQDHYKKYQDCGIVLSKSSDEVTIKHGVRTELYLNIKFRNSGNKAIEVSPTTYFNTDVNELVCFSFNIEKTWEEITIFIIGAVTLGYTAFMLLIAFFWWVFTGKNFFKED